MSAKSLASRWPRDFDLCQKVLFHIACLSMLAWYSWGSVSSYLSGPTSTAINEGDLSEEKKLPEIQICRKPAFRMDALKKHGFADIMTYILSGQEQNGWRGNGSTTPWQVYEDVVAMRSAKEVVSGINTFYWRFQDKSYVEYNYTSDSDFEDRVVAYRLAYKCFTLLPKMSGGVEKMLGKYSIRMFANAASNDSVFYVEVNYPGQFYYYLPKFMYKGPEIVLKPKLQRLYYVLLSFRKLLPDDPKADCIEYGSPGAPYKSYDECMISKFSKEITDLYGCNVPIVAKKDEKICTKRMDNWQQVAFGQETLGYTRCKKPCTTMQVNVILQNAISADYNNSEVMLAIFPETTVFADTLFFQVTQSQYSTSPLTVMADLGGYLGLWLGASVLDLSHLVTYFLGKTYK